MDWEPNSFELQATTVWNFPERGSWATHDASYRGNWSPFVPRNIILRYSSPHDLILDQFAGSGTTLIEAKLLNRDSIGVDINPEAIERCRANSSFEWTDGGKVFLKVGDSRKLLFIPDESIDLICTHPPYANIIKYSVDIEEDLSRLSPEHFLHELFKVASESYRILKRGKYCAVMMGDIRRRGCVYPLAFRTMEIFQKVGFQLKEIVIKEQHNCQETKKWKKKSEKANFLLLAHEYLFIFIKRH